MNIKDKLSKYLLEKLLALYQKTFIEYPRIIGEAHFILRGPDGKIKTERYFKNLITDNGEEMLADLIGGNSTDAVTHIGVGTGTTPPAEVDEDLEAQIEDRHVLDSHVRTGSYVELKSTFGAGHATDALTESGAFDNFSATTDTMLCHQTFDVINKGASDSLEVNWKITFS